MDYNHRRKGSLLEGEELFFSKILSRDSAVGCSSRILYYRSSEGVPFKWEMQPGTPKDPPKEDVILPLTPPPAVLNLRLPKPCFNIEEPKVSIRSKFMFWKQSKKNQEIKKMSSKESSDHVDEFNSDNFVNFEFYSSDGEELTASPRNSSSSSSSSSTFSLPNTHNYVQSSGLQNPVRGKVDGIYGCSPWNITSILVCVGRRI